MEINNYSNLFYRPKDNRSIEELLYSDNFPKGLWKIITMEEKQLSKL